MYNIHSIEPNRFTYIYTSIYLHISVWKHMHSSTFMSRYPYCAVVYMSTCPPTRMSTYIDVFLYLYLYLHLSPYRYPYPYLYLYPYLYPSTPLPFCPSTSLPLYFSTPLPLPIPVPALNTRVSISNIYLIIY